MSDFVFSMKRDGTAVLEGYEGNADRLDIPRTYDGHPVTSIADNAFSWESRLRSVHIPDTVTTIGEAAFSWCESLTEIDIPSSVRTIGEWALLRAE